MTYEFGDKTKPTLVLLHGYLSSAMIQYKIFKYLENDFHVILIDNLGFGVSSRPTFLGKNYDDAIEYFLQIFEKWRMKMNLTDFNLVGYSMGGYIWAKYALKYPQHIKKLALWSPLGMEPAPENPDEYMLQKLESLSIFRPVAMKLVQWNCQNVFNYIDFFRLGGSLFHGLTSSLTVGDAIDSYGSCQKEVFKKFKNQTLLAKESSEVVLTYLTKYYVMPHEPLLNDLDKFEKFGIDLSIVYGNKTDFLNTDFEQSGEPISDRLFARGWNVHVLEHSDHDLVSHEPKKLTTLLKSFLI